MPAQHEPLRAQGQGRRCGIWMNTIERRSPGNRASLRLTKVPAAGGAWM